MTNKSARKVLARTIRPLLADLGIGKKHRFILSNRLAKKVYGRMTLAQGFQALGFDTQGVHSDTCDCGGHCNDVTLVFHLGHSIRL